MLSLLKNLISRYLKKEIVTFTPYHEGYINTSPLPMKKVIPEYYKKAPKEFGTKKENGPNNYTYKTCPAFLDAFTVGYALRCPSDIFITCREDSFMWELPSDVPDNIITSHNSDQIQYGKAGSIIDEERYYPYVLKINPCYFFGNSSNVGWQILPAYSDKENMRNFEAVYGYFDNLLLDRYGTLPINCWVRRRPKEDNQFIIKKGSIISTLVPFSYTSFYAKINKPDEDMVKNIEKGAMIKNRGKFFANSLNVHRVSKTYS